MGELRDYLGSWTPRWSRKRGLGITYIRPWVATWGINQSKPQSFKAPSLLSPSPCLASLPSLSSMPRVSLREISEERKKEQGSFLSKGPRINLGIQICKIEASSWRRFQICWRRGDCKNLAVQCPRGFDCASPMWIPAEARYLCGLIKTPGSRYSDQIRISSLQGWLDSDPGKPKS